MRGATHVIVPLAIATDGATVLILVIVRFSRSPVSILRRFLRVGQHPVPPLRSLENQSRHLCLNNKKNRAGDDGCIPTLFVHLTKGTVKTRVCDHQTLNRLMANAPDCQKAPTRRSARSQRSIV
ncbi:hypothetical protein C0Q70_11955 [Pomacea canaliculata]|uniref:Uncharacterized protein n=1 Tax=Pomacea canaliculata TaxID=400727 RepID=A0A2T7P7F4_POMCA|nr:hypothetical protein C0Q70_11955 [Pomacea canaliculata]